MKKSLILITMLATISVTAQADPNNDGMVIALQGSNVDAVILPVLKREEEREAEQEQTEILVPVVEKEKTKVVGEKVID